jgi:hypothetical protein
LVSCKRAVTTEALAAVLVFCNIDSACEPLAPYIQELLEPLFKRSRLHDVFMVGPVSHLG